MNDIGRIKDSGVVGAGGAGFPTHVKFSEKTEYVIINAAECEPLIRVDEELILNHTEDFLDGVGKLVEMTEAKKGIVAIKEKHGAAVDKLRILMSARENIEVFLLKDFYPAGDEQVLVYEALKRVVPQGGIPLNVSCIVTNVETVLNAFHAFDGKPVTHTYVTVNGEVDRPSTYRIPVGTSYKEALEASGVRGFENKTAIDGGPMMGKVIENLDDPVTKTTKSIILLDKGHDLIRKKTISMRQVLKQSRTACIQCSKCTDLCPRNLLGHEVQPHKVMRVVGYGLKDLSGLTMAQGCSECGVCELYACPNGLLPRRVNVKVKEELAKANVRIDTSSKSYQASPLSDYRRIPVKRLVKRLGIERYDVEAPLTEHDFMPGKVEIPLKQHVGKPSDPQVIKGDYVEEGDLIAALDGNSLGANIHASISGVVSEVKERSIVITRIKGGIYND